MKRIGIICIVIFACSVAVTLFVLFSNTNNTSNTSPTQKYTPSTSIIKPEDVIAHITLTSAGAILPSGKVGSLVPLLVTIQAEKEFRGVQLVIQYDKTTLTLESTEPGNFFENPIVSKKDTEGLLFYSVTSDKNATGSGTLVSLNFRCIKPTNAAFVLVHSDTSLATGTSQKPVVTLPEPLFFPIEK